MFMYFVLGSIATAEGSSIVKLGNTTIVCGVKAVSTTYQRINFYAVYIWGDNLAEQYNCDFSNKLRSFVM